MNKIIVTGYMGSGSSAVTDLLSEYENVHCPNGSYEYIFMHCPGGLFDLEDKLLIGNTALRSDEAIRAFRHAMHDLYENGRWWFAGYESKVSNQFMQFVDEFIAAITTSAYEGFWYEHEKLSRAAWLKNRIKTKLGAAPYELLATELDMAFPTSQEFYEAAQIFVEKTLAGIAGTAGETGRAALLLDQLLLPHNLWRLENYFDIADTRAVVVSRDPRDVFVLNKYAWSVRGVDMVPMPHDVNEFCKYYRRMRESEKPTLSDAVLRVNFEDLVFKYDETVTAIENCMGHSMLGDHKSKGTLFNPNVSRNNIGVFASSVTMQEEAAVIERELTEYLYPLEEEIVLANTISKAF